MDREREQIRDRLLVATIGHVPFDGWTMKALHAGAADLDMDRVDIERWFPGGVADMAGHFGSWADRRMEEALEAHGLDGLSVRARIALAVRLRLEALAPHREAVRATVAWAALPPNAPHGLRALYNTVDAMWYGIGDTSADFNFYTKRALLAGVFTATTLYWLGDESEGFKDSWAFLERRIEDVLKVPKLRARCERLAKSLPDPFRFLRVLKSGGVGRR